MKLKLKLPEATELKQIPVRYTAVGQNVNPRLDWSDVPSGTQEFALICEDPDSPFPKPFVHWVVYGLSANISTLPTGLPDSGELNFPVLCRQGKNSLQKLGYTGPNPPFFHKRHQYVFRLFALKEPLPLKAGATREELLHELKGKIIAEANTVAYFGKTIPQRARAVALWAGLAAGLGVAFWLMRPRRGLSKQSPDYPRELRV